MPLLMTPKYRPRSYTTRATMHILTPRFPFSTHSSKRTSSHSPPLTTGRPGTLLSERRSSIRAQRKLSKAQSSRSRNPRWGAIYAQALVSSHPRSLRAPSRIHDPARPLLLMLPSSRSSSSRLFRAVLCF